MRRPLLKAASPDRLAAELQRLSGLDEASLRRRWQASFGRAPSERLGRALLHRMIAYRVQADALGDLDRDTARMLDRLATGGDELIPPLDVLGTKPGTVLVREWGGSHHQVMVLQEGFAWNGQTFDSLSRVAQAITGTKWNGPRFFGLRDKPVTECRRVAP